MTKTEANGVRASSNRNEVTLGMMGVQIQNIEGRIMNVEKGIENLGQKIDDKYVTRIEYAETTRQISSIQDNVKWIVRVVIGAVATAVIGFVLISK